MKRTICRRIGGILFVLSTLVDAHAAEKVLTVSKADFVMSQDEASRFSTDVVSPIVFDLVDHGDSEPEALRMRIQNLLARIQRHEIDYIAIPAYYPVRKMCVVAKVERLDSKTAVILFIPELMNWKKTTSDLEFKYGLLITLAHESIHLELGHDQRAATDKQSAKFEAEAWAQTILQVIRTLEAKGSPVPRQFKEFSDLFKRVHDDASDPRWVKVFSNQVSK